MVIDQERPRTVNLTAVEDLLEFHREGTEKRVVVSASTSRLLAVCAAPMAAAAGLFSAASYYHRTIPAGEMLMRKTIVSVCVGVGVLAMLVALVILIYNWHCRLDIRVEGLGLQVGSGEEIYPWKDVTIGFPRGQGGFRHVTVQTPDGQTTLSELIFPTLRANYGLLSSRATQARRSDDGQILPQS